MTSPLTKTSMLNFEPATEVFFKDVVAGLRATPKSLPCKYFYDERGSQLFDAICALDEYYLTRTELGIMRQYASEMADQIGPEVMLIEYGSGSSIKTRLLLDQLRDPVAYVPVDISRDHLQRTADGLSRAYPHLEVLPICADFTEDFQLPVSRRVPSHVAVYFPGSTIGNFTPKASQAMLARLASRCGAGGGLLIGIDLQKDAATIEAAYNDTAGVTADFNLNLLRRINHELDADFDHGQFEHLAYYNDQQGRMEIYLISQIEQVATVGGESFKFAANEAICTEYSHKYTIEGFARDAAEVGLVLRRHWTDGERKFGVLHLAVIE